MDPSVVCKCVGALQNAAIAVNSAAGGSAEGWELHFPVRGNEWFLVDARVVRHRVVDNFAMNSELKVEANILIY